MKKKLSIHEYAELFADFKIHESAMFVSLGFEIEKYRRTRAQLVDSYIVEFTAINNKR